LPFWGLSLPFWETPEILEETLVRHFRGVYWDHVPTKSKEIGPGVEGQEEQHFTDGTDGPSISTDPALPPSTHMLIPQFKL